MKERYDKFEMRCPRHSIYIYSLNKKVNYNNHSLLLFYCKECDAYHTYLPGMTNGIIIGKYNKKHVYNSTNSKPVQTSLIAKQNAIKKRKYRYNDNSMNKVSKRERSKMLIYGNPHDPRTNAKTGELPLDYRGNGSSYKNCYNIWWNANNPITCGRGNF